MIKIVLGICLVAMLALYFLQEKLLFFPTQLSKDYPFRFPHSFEEINLEVAEDIELNMLLFKAVASKGVVLFFHGKKDVLIPYEHALRLKEANPQVQLHILEGYGHNDTSQSPELWRKMAVVLE